METHTLDAMVERTKEYKLSRKWIVAANALRRKIAAWWKNTRGDLRRISYAERRAQNAERRQERRELVKEMRSLFKDARAQYQFAQDSILGRAQVICATAAGADGRVMGDINFDLVVLDEATQAADPLALIAFAR